MTDDNDQLRRGTADLDRQCVHLRQQGRLLIEEKTQLTQRLENTETELIELRHTLGDVARQTADAWQEQAEGGGTKNDGDAAKEEVVDRENMPRFSLAELRFVLNEKNELKARLLAAEEQLDELHTKLKAHEKKE